MTRQVPTVGNVVYYKNDQTKTVESGRLFALYHTYMRPHVQDIIPQCYQNQNK